MHGFLFNAGRRQPASLTNIYVIQNNTRETNNFGAFSVRPVSERNINFNHVVKKTCASQRAPSVDTQSRDQAFAVPKSRPARKIQKARQPPGGEKGALPQRIVLQLPPATRFSLKTDALIIECAHKKRALRKLAAFSQQDFSAMLERSALLTKLDKQHKQSIRQWAAKHPEACAAQHLVYREQQKKLRISFE